MPILASAQLQVEVVLAGTVAAGGSNNRLPTWKFHFSRPSSTTPVNKASVVTAFQAAIVPNLLACLNHRITNSATLCRILNDATDPYYLATQTGVGAITGDSMPTFCSAYVLVQTGLRGKQYRGSKHFFPLSESDTTSGSDDVLNAASITRFQTFLTSWLAGFTDGGGNVWTPVLFQKSSSQIRTNPTVVNVATITQLQIRASIGRMRRREVKSVYA